MARRGAPSKFSDDREEVIIHTIRDGGTLKDAAAASGVDVSTIKRWLDHEDRAEFRARYVRAREDQADAFADEIIEVARDKTRDPQQARLQVDALKWAAGKRKGSVYGDKSHTEITGAGGAPLFSEIAVRFIEPKKEGGE